MNVTIFGATGRTGRHLVEQALAAGHQVTAFARSPSKLDDLKAQNLQIVQGTIEQPERVEEAVREADVVVSALGPTENKPTFTVTKGTQYILDAMKKHGVQRIIVSAGMGVPDPHDEPKFINHAINVILNLVSRHVVADMSQVVDTVRSSDVEWVVVRVPMLTDDPATGEIKVGYVGKGVGGRLSRADMAHFMLEQIDDPQYLQKAPAISN
ncbi:MAG: SDR family oxidoreductase [Chloroflexi bacterium]|nr:SDR family oxidoreductase [Chloroflexota bacterium]